LLQGIKSLTDGPGLSFYLNIKEENILEHMMKITQSLELSKKNVYYEICEERNMENAITSNTISVYNSGILWPHKAVDSRETTLVADNESN
jgi:hypothetical protein